MFVALSPAFLSKYLKDLRQLKICKIEGCEKEAKNGLLCGMHHSRIQRHGDPHKVNKPGRPVGSTGYQGGGYKAVVGYRAMHYRLSRYRGKASTFLCVDDCGRMASEWSMSHDATDVLVSNVPNTVGKEYTLDLDMYDARCRTCHRIYDGVTMEAARAGRWSE